MQFNSMRPSYQHLVVDRNGIGPHDVLFTHNQNSLFADSISGQDLKHREVHGCPATGILCQGVFQVGIEEIPVGEAIVGLGFK